MDPNAGHLNDILARVFEQFSQKSNARGIARGGMLKLRFDRYITSWLPYINYSMSHRFEIFSAPGTIAHGSIRLPPRSLASSRGCALAIV